MDHEVPEPLAHYKAIMRALGRLSGTHKAGRLSPRFDDVFPFDPAALIAADKLTRDESQLQARVLRIGEFAAKYPSLLPKNISSPDFIARMKAEIPLFVEHEIAIKKFLLGKPDFIALCHWNANIDNAWFWRNDADVLECGLIDWGRVGRMSIAQAIYGAFSGAEVALWDHHLGEIVATFAEEFESCGGPAVDREELTVHLQLTTQMMGLTYQMDSPAVIQRQVPDLAEAEGSLDRRFRENEIVRMRLKMMTMFLNLWETRDTGGLLKRLLRSGALN